MKPRLSTQISSRRHEQANVLLAALVTMLIIGVALITYLTLTKNQNQLVTRAQVWNACLPVAEAGIEDALNHVAWNSSNLTAAGWTRSGTNYYRTGVIGGSWYAVRLSSNLSPASVTATGFVRMPGTTQDISRAIQVSAIKVPPYKYAIKTKGGVYANGNGCLIDSYDSSDPAKSTGGMYDSAKAGDQADVFCMKATGTAVDLGNGNIWGHVSIPPGATATTGPNGKVGSRAWNLSGNKGIQPGWLRTDSNISIPDASCPFTGGVPPLPGIVGGVAYSAILDNGIFSTATLVGRVLVKGDAYIYVSGNVDVSRLVIQTNCSVKIYCDGVSAKFDNLVNGPRRASANQFFGLPGCKTISFNNDWMGTIYAPDADFDLRGNTTMYGCVVAKSFTLKGTSDYHYDASLNNPTNQAGSLIITTWTEL